MWLSERPGVRLIACTPADDQARIALMKLSVIGPWRIDWELPEPDALEGQEIRPALQR